MSMGNRLIEPMDYAERNGCELHEAIEALHWNEREIQRKEFKRVDGLPEKKANQTDETLPF